MLPYGATETFPTTNNAWALVYPDGSILTGIVPSTAGPITAYDLVNSWSWTWASSTFVAPVVPGTLVRGILPFSAATTGSVLFSVAFASSAYVIKLTPEADTVTGNIPAVAYASKTTTGFDVVVSGVYSGEVAYEAVL